MELIKLIKKRSSTRSYRKSPLKKSEISKIIEAGIMGPYLSNFQLIRLVVVKNRKIKNQIKKILKVNYKKLGISGRAVFFPGTIKAVESAPVFIAVYNSGQFSYLIKKFAKFATRSKENIYIKIAKQTEIAAISAAIQNMILMAENLGIGSCWLHIPLFFKKEINSLLKENRDLVAMLTLGYRAERGYRAPRKAISETVRYL